MQRSGEIGDDLSDDLKMPSFPFGNKVQQQQQQQHDVSLSAKLFSIQMTPVTTALKPLPVWIENHTSFISTPQADPQTLLQALQEALNRGPSCVDVVINADKGKLRGIVSQQGRYARFQIRLYSYVKGIVVEFQRREGDAMLLSGMFQSVLVALGPNLVARRWDSAVIAAPPPAFPMDLPLELEKSPVNILTTLDNLMALSESPLIDHQKEAVSGLVSLSAEHATLLAEAACTSRPLLLILIKLLASHNLIDIVRGSAVCLSNLLQAYSEMCKPGRKHSGPSTTNKLSMDDCRALLASMLENLCSPALLESLDTKRHISKSLQSLAKAHPQLLASDRGCVSTLNKFKSSKDAVLRAHVLDTLQLIQSNA